MKVDDMGKGTRLDSDTLKSAIFYVIEFKGGRSDVYYSATAIKKDDLVIVEADRGRDLGKVTKENISRDQLEIYYSQLKNSNLEEKKKYMPNEIYIKCIFRLARADEITLLIAKSQDEAKALMVCQSKIKQKKLNMQVVDAEYQWYIYKYIQKRESWADVGIFFIRDRRKLTFYFIAEKRVDFRELVRELFKLYKTRIWM
jgi:cell fate regulator YaaT (PSP1 superfamily)